MSDRQATEKLRCKMCLTEYGSLQDHVHHFELSHKVNFKSLIDCGYPDCSAKVRNLVKYEDHIKDFHASQTNCIPEAESDALVYKCAYPGCNFKGKKSTVKTHKWWNHPRSKDIPPVANPTPEEASLDNSSPSSAPGRSSTSDDSTTLQELVFENSCLPVCRETFTSDAPISSEGQVPVSVQNVCGDQVLLKKFVHMGLSLTSKFHVPDSTLHYILQSYRLLLKENSDRSTSVLRDELSALGHGDNVIESIVQNVISNDVMLKMHGPDGPMRSYYCRQEQYKNIFPYVQPKEHVLGYNEFNELCKCHYIPPKESLKMLFADDSVYEQYLERRQRTSVLSEDLDDFMSGTTFQNHPLFSCDSGALQLIVYQDDVDMCNSIGPAGGTFKLLHMGYTLGNLHPWNRSKVDPLQVLLLCKEKDVSYFGLEKVLEPVIKAFKELEEEGVEIRGETLKASVLVLLGDNLGTHMISGFTEGFATSKYFCRYCEESRQEWRKRWYTPDRIVNIPEAEDSSSDSDSSSSSDSEEGETEEIVCSNNEEDDSDDDVPLAELIPLSTLNQQLRKNKAPLRTIQSYEECVKELKKEPAGVKGVVGKSELNKLKYFHVVKGTPPCVPHDIFHGVAAYDVMLSLKKLKKEYKFTFAWLNRRIKSFKFQGVERLDKPPAKFSMSRKKLKGNAVQNWVFIRFLPLLLGEKITNKSDPIWTMILTLIEILSLITSPVISKSVLSYLDRLIMKYLQLRSTLFNVPLRPKHHFLEHYVMLILMFGPLMRSSTLRFESKHIFLRSELRAKKCLKNPTLTLAKAHQKMQSSLSINSIFERFPVIENPVSFDNLTVEDDVVNFIVAVYGREYASKRLLFSKKMTYHNTVYEEEKVLVTSTAKHPQIECCKISVLLSDGTSGFAIGIKCDATLIKEMQAYTLTETPQITVVALDTLKDFVPYSLYYHEHQSVVVLKHLYLTK